MAPEDRRRQHGYDGRKREGHDRIPAPKHADRDSYRRSEREGYRDRQYRDSGGDGDYSRGPQDHRSDRQQQGYRREQGPPRQQLPVPPGRSADREAYDRQPPVRSATPPLPGKPGPKLPVNSVLAELARQARQREQAAAAQRGSESPGSGSDGGRKRRASLEEGEEEGEEVPAKRQAVEGARGRPQSLLERQQQEIAEFKHLQALQEQEVALKPSPSMSGEEEEEESRSRSATASEQGSPGDEADEGEQPSRSGRSGGAAAGRASRWADASPSTSGGGGGDEAQQREETAEEEEAALRRLNDAEREELADGAADGQEEGQAQEGAKVPDKMVNMRAGCRHVSVYERLGYISEGTYGKVFKAREKESGRLYALKKVKMDKEREGFPLTSIREINILLNCTHDNIVNVREVVMGHSLDDIYMVMEYCEHDLKAIMERREFAGWSLAEAKTLMLQLLSGIAYLHSRWVLHRDLKTSNVLYNNHGVLKICDFGMARQYGSPLEGYTQLVVTLWYRAPELLLGADRYSTAVDMWSVGCIMGELLSGKQLLQGQGEVDQLKKTFALLGTPTADSWPGVEDLPNWQRLKFAPLRSRLRERFPKVALHGSTPPLTDAGFDLLSRLLALDPAQRISAEDALAHPWFAEHPRPKAAIEMPTFAEKRKPGQ